MVSHEKIPFTTGVRLGIIMYGLNGNVKINTHGIKGKLRKIKRRIYEKKHNISEAIYENNLNLKTAFSLYSEVISLRSVKKGEYVGYNAEYKVEEESLIATIAIGYADGVDKSFKYVCINNKLYNIISDSMDMIMVLVDNNVKIGNTVEIFGDKITVKDTASRLNTNSYHLFTRITTRVPRIHLEDKKEYEVKY